MEKIRLNPHRMMSRLFAGWNTGRPLASENKTTSQSKLVQLLEMESCESVVEGDVTV
jgi:hypothetical protein